MILQKITLASIHVRFWLFYIKKSRIECSLTFTHNFCRYQARKVSARVCNNVYKICVLGVLILSPFLQF